LPAPAARTLGAAHRLGKRLPRQTQHVLLCKARIHLHLAKFRSGCSGSGSRVAATYNLNLKMVGASHDTLAQCTLLRLALLGQHLGRTTRHDLIPGRPGADTFERCLVRVASRALRVVVHAATRRLRPAAPSRFGSPAHGRIVPVHFNPFRNRSEKSYKNFSCSFSRDVGVIPRL
jgi:hypothetical protein